MPSPTVDYILGDVLMHDHEAGDITGLVLHDPVTIGTNTASALSLSGQELSLGDKFVQLAGDTMTGNLILSNSINLQSKTTGGTTYTMIGSWSDDNLYIGSSFQSGDTILRSGFGEVMRLTAGGYVGVGITNPPLVFYVQTAGDATIGSRSTSSSQFAGINLYDYNGNNAASFQYGNSSASAFVNEFVIASRQATIPVIFYQGGVSASNKRITLDTSGNVLFNGNVGIGTTSPTNILSLGGNSARTFWLERHTTANTAGNTLTVTAGGATSGATDKAGGALILQGGLSTGSAESGVTIQGCVAGASGTTDRTQTTMIQVLGNKLSFYNQTPVVRPTELTDELTTLTFSAPGTPDYAIADLTATLPYGFASADEGQTVLSVIANLQTRVNELETKLTALGLLQDAD